MKRKTISLCNFMERSWVGETGIKESTPNMDQFISFVSRYFFILKISDISHSCTLVLAPMTSVPVTSDRDLSRRKEVTESGIWLTTKTFPSFRQVLPVRWSRPVDISVDS